MASETTEPLGCNYQGYEFGGGYLDSVCIDGLLWDADSCDEPGGPLYRGGELACPQCNTEQFLADALTQAKGGGSGRMQAGSFDHAYVAGYDFEKRVLYAARLNRPAVDRFLATLEPFETDDWADRATVQANPHLWNETIDVVVTRDTLRAALGKVEGK